MSELRDLVIDAHGGMERWSKVKTIDGDMSIAGALWARKGWPDALKAVHVTADTRSQLDQLPALHKWTSHFAARDRRNQ